MNIKDEKLINLRDALYVKRDGEIIFNGTPHFGHTKVADIFYGIDVTMNEKEALKNQQRFLMYERYCAESNHISMIDFLVRFYGYDRCCYTSIITTRSNPYDTYFNYYLEGYDIHSTSPIYLDSKTNRFYVPKPDLEVMQRRLVLRNEADDLKTRFPKKELKNYYK